MYYIVVNFIVKKATSPSLNKRMQCNKGDQRDKGLFLRRYDLMI